MITTLYFIQFVAFYLWQITAAKRKPVAVGGLLTYASANKSQARLIGAALCLVACVGFVLQWGLASGIVGFLVGLMAVGCLSVVIEPFNYLRIQGVAAIYVCCVILEMIL
jgi:multisubunit Na+/H+ antiporter MnhE subunit